MSRRSTLTIGSYVVEGVLGSGSFATVYKACHKEEGTTVAIKAISLARLDKKSRENLESEITILQQVRHPNIVRLMDIQKSKNYIYLVLEFCAGGDLGSLLRKAGPFREDVARAMMRQLADGVECLWSRSLIHRDLKPQNLLLEGSPRLPQLKIADFGFARHLQVTDMAETLCGSPLYMAPEILRFEKYDGKCDLWSCGVILYEMVVGKTPFTGRNPMELLRNIESQEMTIPEDRRAVLSDSVQSLLQLLLRRNPMDRASFQEFFAHPWLSGGPTRSLGLGPMDAAGTRGASDADQAAQAVVFDSRGSHRAEGRKRGGGAGSNKDDDREAGAAAAEGGGGEMGSASPSVATPTARKRSRAGSGGSGRHSETMQESGTGTGASSSSSSSRRYRRSSSAASAGSAGGTSSLRALRHRRSSMELFGVPTQSLDAGATEPDESTHSHTYTTRGNRASFVFPAETNEEAAEKEPGQMSDSLYSSRAGRVAAATKEAEQHSVHTIRTVSGDDGSSDRRGSLRVRVGQDHPADSQGGGNAASGAAETAKVHGSALPGSQEPSRIVVAPRLPPLPLRGAAQRSYPGPMELCHAARVVVALARRRAMAAAGVNQTAWVVCGVGSSIHKPNGNESERGSMASHDDTGGTHPAALFGRRDTLPLPWDLGQLSLATAGCEVGWEAPSGVFSTARGDGALASSPIEAETRGGSCATDPNPTRLYRQGPEAPTPSNSPSSPWAGDSSFRSLHQGADADNEGSGEEDGLPPLQQHEQREEERSGQCGWYKALAHRSATACAHLFLEALSLYLAGLELVARARLLCTAEGSALHKWCQSAIRTCSEQARACLVHVSQRFHTLPPLPSAADVLAAEARRYGRHAIAVAALGGLSRAGDLGKATSSALHERLRSRRHVAHPVGQPARNGEENGAKEDDDDSDDDEEERSKQEGHCKRRVPTTAWSENGADSEEDSTRPWPPAPSPSSDSSARRSDDDERDGATQQDTGLTDPPSFANYEAAEPALAMTPPREGSERGGSQFGMVSPASEPVGFRSASGAKSPPTLPVGARSEKRPPKPTTGGRRSTRSPWQRALLTNAAAVAREGQRLLLASLWLRVPEPSVVADSSDQRDRNGADTAATPLHGWRVWVGGVVGEEESGRIEALERDMESDKKLLQTPLAESIGAPTLHRVLEWIVASAIQVQ